MQSWTWRAQMLAEDTSIKVIEDPEATTFSIDQSGTLRVPVLDQNSAAASRMLAGGTLHEVAHRLWSSFEVIGAAAPVVAKFLMKFEDHRIERRAGEKWGGAAEELTAAWQELYEAGRVARPTSADAPVIALLSIYCLAACRAMTWPLKQAIKDRPIARQHLVDAVGEELATEVDQHLSRVPELASTAECRDLAIKLLSPFVPPSDLTGPEAAESEEPEESEDQQGASKGSSTGQSDGDSEADPEASDGTQAVPGEPSDEEGEEGSGEAASTPSTTDESEQSDEAQKANGKASPEPSAAERALEDLEVDGGELFANAVRDIVGSAGGHEGGEQEVVETQQDERILSDGEVLLDSAAAATTALKARLDQLLQTMTRRRPRAGSRGRIRPERVWRVKFGKDDIWRQRTESLRLDTYIHALFDMSGSMDGYKATMAMQSAAALAMACESLHGVACAMDRFPAQSDSAALGVLKTVDESYRVGAQRMAGAAACGGTPMLQAIATAMRSIALRKEERKLLIIATDGMPAEQDRTRQAIRLLKASGMQVLTIGIGTSAKAIDPDACEIRSIDALPTVMFEALERLLHEHDLAA